GLGIKMFLQSKNILIVAAAIALGGVLGLLLGIHEGLESFAEWAKGTFGGQNPGRFTEAVITTSILFCVGPMTLLGCMQDALEDKVELLAIKSTLDGFAAFFFGAALGPGVLVTAAVVLIFQSVLTFAARPLRGVAGDEALISEITAAGGVMLMGTGLGLLEIKTDLPVANYLPALVLAPALVGLSRIIGSGKRKSTLKV
ncbi:MAG TPA: DUF554 family protein, partial [Fimbriimonadaceae bacterium]|nr:DUF554 family protein [Fimbriimonadaceae bacterium]